MVTKHFWNNFKFPFFNKTPNGKTTQITFSPIGNLNYELSVTRTCIYKKKRIMLF